MILAERGETAELGECEALYGPVLLKKQDPVLREALEKQLQVNSNIRLQLALNPSDKTIARLKTIEKEEALLYEALSYYQCS